MEVIWAIRRIARERVSGQKVLGTNANSASRDVRDDFINTGHGFHGEISWKAYTQPEGLVSSDAVSADVRA
jgi:3-methyladenine DNA glycosylase Tag